MTITDSARRLALVAVVAMLAALLPLSGAFAQDPPADDAPVVVDLDAEDADDATGVSTRISQFTFESSTEALLGRDDVFADSLASGSLQGGGRPLLLTASDSLDSRVVDELNRLGVETVHILGLEDAISADVEADLADAGFETNRFGGETRIETAVDIAQVFDGDTAILARAFANDDPTQAFADSLAAGGWAAEAQVPVLLTQTEVLTGNTAAQIADGGYANVIVVGGESAISEDVVAEVEALGATVTRVAGDTRFETAVAIANERGFADSSDADFTIVADGQGGDAWVDGFAAAALAGLTPAPIVLSNSADAGNLPAPTADFLVDETGDAVAGFAQDAGATFELVEQDPNIVAVCLPGVTGEDCEAVQDETGAETIVSPPRPGTATVEPSSVAAGGDVTVTIPDAQPGDEIVITGCGVDETVTIDEDHEGDAVITVTIPATQAAGECELSVTVNGEELGPFTVTVTEPAGNQTVTTRPELVRASIGTTTTATMATASNPAGTTVIYEFDEPLSSATAGQFFLHRADNTRYTGAAIVGFTAGSTSVTVRFTDAFLQTTSNIAQLTLATVNDGAVTTSDGAFNPEGDAPVGTASSTTGQAGTTNAPDLMTVGGFRAATPSTQTAVDFTFDEAAFLQGAADFDLIPTNGGLPVQCTTDATANRPSGGSVAGGQGTTTITVLCPNAGGTTTTLSAADFARGVVGQGSVSDSGTSTTNLNPMQAADISNAGNTIDPDLLSAEFQPDAMSGTTAVDRVIYVFDQNVATAGASTGYNIYDASGAPAQENGTVVQVTNNRVAVDFPNGSLSDAVGASVDDGTVGSTTGAGTTNEDDEVGVANTSATTITPGQTAGPQLTAVALAEATDATGASVGFRATYTFDKDVDIVANNRFFLWQADGDRLTAQSCTNPSAEDTDNTVTCSFIAAGVATSSDVAESVLGTVDFDAVRDEGAAAAGLASNPEGGEVTTGGTGTPAN